MLYKRQSLSGASNELYGETENHMVPESKEVPNKNDGANQKGTEANLKEFPKARAGTIQATSKNSVGLKPKDTIKVQSVSL